VLVVEVVVVPVVFVLLLLLLRVLELMLSCKVAETLEGGVIPRFRIFVFET
jgi:hypothetical protein